MSASEPIEESTELTLKDVLDDYQKSIAVAGVFLALGIFSQHQLGPERTFGIPASCFALALIVFVSMLFDKRPRRVRFDLIMFFSILLSLILTMTYQFIATFPREAWNIVRIMTFGGVLAWRYRIATPLYNSRMLELKQLQEAENQRFEKDDSISDEEKKVSKDRSEKELLRYRRLVTAQWWISMIIAVLIPNAVLILSEGFGLGLWYTIQPIPEVPPVENN